MIMKLNDKRVIPIKELSEAVPLKDIESEFAVKGANLWMSLNKLKVHEPLLVCTGRKTYSKNWPKTLKNEEECIIKPKLMK